MNIEHLQNAIKCALASYSQNELAMLALTSKIEHSIRDRVAFALWAKTDHEKIYAREWKRIDLAELENANPTALLEFKAMYAYDLFTGNANQYIKYLDSDQDKMRIIRGNNNNNDIKTYNVGLIVNPLSSTNIDQESYIKYERQIRRDFRMNGGTSRNVEEIEFMAVCLFYPNLDNFDINNCISFGQHNAGQFDGIDVELIYFIRQNPHENAG
jgi:hypothetical protein